MPRMPREERMRFRPIQADRDPCGRSREAAGPRANARGSRFFQHQRSRRKIEALFGELKNRIGLRRVRLRRLRHVREQFLWQLLPRTSNALSYTSHRGAPASNNKNLNSKLRQEQRFYFCRNRPIAIKRPRVFQQLQISGHFPDVWIPHEIHPSRGNHHTVTHSLLHAGCDNRLGRIVTCQIYSFLNIALEEEVELPKVLLAPGGLVFGIADPDGVNTGTLRTS